jgi:hypothetical protein
MSPDRKRPRRRSRSQANLSLAGEPPPRERCTAKTAKGTRCRRMALDGIKLCSVHAGARVGRPSKLSDEITGRICDILQAGGYTATAVNVAGVARSTFTEWMDRGDPDGTAKENAPYREFRERVEQAMAEGETRNVALIARAGSKDWKAAAWLLERRHPDRWAGPRGRGIDSSVHPGDFAQGETSAPQDVVDDQVGPDGRPL